jgi:hypothetical protein
MRYHVTLILLLFTLLSNGFSAENKALISLTLTADTLELAVGNTTSLHVNATYQDATTKPLTTNLQWSIDDTTKASITGTTLTALKEGTTALHVNQNTITSNILHVTVYKTINGHRLPPEPDETLNNSTLLGIDTNNNGVRDDVERKIYTTFTRPIEQAVAMQYARNYTVALSTPLERDKARSASRNEKATDCYIFLRFNLKIPIYDSPLKFAKEATLNTKDRIRRYFDFDLLLSGGIYTGKRAKDLNASYCDFNVTKMLEMGQ